MHQMPSGHPPGGNQAAAGMLFGQLLRLRVTVLYMEVGAMAAAKAHASAGFTSNYELTPQDIQAAYLFSILIKRFRKDEVLEIPEFRISCHSTFLSKKSHTKVQTRWTIWKTFEEFQQLDE